VGIRKKLQTLKGFASRLTLSGLIVDLQLIPWLSLRSNHGLKLANASGVKSKPCIIVEEDKRQRYFLS
jgi:hypothetical protein